MLSTIVRKNTEHTRLSPLYIYNTAHILRPGTPVFTVRREPTIHRPPACTYLLDRSQMPRWISSRMAPPVSRFTASSSRVGQGRPATGRRVGPRRLMRQPAPLPSWYTPGRTCPGPVAARPTDSPRVVRLLVSLRGENTQHRQPGRRQTDAPHHQEERARVATTLASRRNHHRDRRRRSGDAPARPARAEGARLAPWASRPDVHGRTQGAEPMQLTRLL